MATDKHTLNDRFRMTGTWWIPGSARRKAAGELVYTPDGITLELTKSLRPPSDSDPFSKVFSPEVVLGRTSGCEVVTLLDCFETSWGFESAQRLHVHAAFLGKHFRDRSRILVRSLRIGYSGLEGWLNPAVFEQKDGRTLRWRMPEPLSIPIDGRGFTIAFLTTPHLQGELTSHHWSYSCSARVSFEKPQSFEAAMRGIEHLRRLLTLLIGKSVAPQTVELGTPPPRQTTQRSKPSVPVRVFFTPIYRGGPDNVHPTRVLFPRDEIAGNVGSVVNAWFRPTRDMWQVTTYSSGRFLRRNCS